MLLRDQEDKGRQPKVRKNITLYKCIYEENNNRDEYLYIGLDIDIRRREVVLISYTEKRSVVQGSVVV